MGADTDEEIVGGGEVIDCLKHFWWRTFDLIEVWVGENEV